MTKALVADKAQHLAGSEIKHAGSIALQGYHLLPEFAHANLPRGISSRDEIVFHCVAHLPVGGARHDTCAR